MRNKGKVHPFSSSSSSPESNNESVLNLLPAAILTLVSVLSLEERHVLAYMITRSLKSTTHLPERKSKQSGAVIIDSHGGGGGLFDCDCFHCYTTFWFRWDSSPNRELIHQAIEAFEDHLSNGDYHQFKKNVAGWKSKRKNKSSRPRRLDDEKTRAAAGPPEENHDRLDNNVGSHDGVAKAEMEVGAAPPPLVNNHNHNHNHKGLARKMLPDVMGIFNSRLWSLWSPNV